MCFQFFACMASFRFVRPCYFLEEAPSRGGPFPHTGSHTCRGPVCLRSATAPWLQRSAVETHRKPGRRLRKPRCGKTAAPQLNHQIQKAASHRHAATSRCRRRPNGIQKVGLSILLDFAWSQDSAKTRSRTGKSTSACGRKANGCSRNSCARSSGRSHSQQAAAAKKKVRPQSQHVQRKAQ